MYDLLIRGGRAVLPGHGVWPADVAIRGGQIAALLAPESDIPAREVVAARGLHIFPGLVDPHVHPGVYKPLAEDYAELTRFAARGGVTTLLHMHRGPGDLLAALPAAIAELEALGVLDFSLNPAPLTTAQAAQIPALLRDWGITTFKFYAGYKGMERSRFGTDRSLDDGFMAEIMLAMRGTRADPVLMVHCENMDLAGWLKDRLAPEFEQSLAYLDATSPAVAEAEFVCRTFLLARHYGVRAYAVHVSAGSTAATAAALPYYDPARTILETCPHYLVLDTTAAAGLGAVVKPPLRPPGEQEGLWEALRRGWIQSIGSDNCSNPLHLKTDLRRCKLGFGEIGFTLPLLLSEGYHRRGISLERIAAVTSANPARICGLAPRKGAIRPGADADLVLVDLERVGEADPAAWKENADGSVYTGMRWQGWPVMTISRGEIIVREGVYTGRPGRGRFVRRLAGEA